MMGAWRECTLGDVLEVKHGFAFLGQHFADKGTHVVLTPGNFFERGGFRAKGDKEKWYTGPIPEDYILRHGDVIVAMTEQAEGLLGSSAIVPQDDRYLHNQRLGLIRPRGADQGFLYHLFNSPMVRQQIRASASGTKVRHTSPSRICAVRVRVPSSLAMQRHIAGILSARDDLIENSERRIHLLDEMARALYREWFVLFRYPGHEKIAMVDSPLGKIPKGWRIAPVGTIAVETRRGVAKGQLRERVPHVGLEHIPRRSLALDAWDETDDLGSNKLRFERGEVLFGKIRPYFHKVSVAPFDGVCSADTFVIAPREPSLYGLMVGLVSSDPFVAHASATANGAKMPRANWGVMADLPVALPPPDLASRFDRFMRPLVAMQQGLVFQTNNVRKTRDLLLPRLLSGQLAVGEVG